MKNKWVRLFVFGSLVWLIPFVVSFGFYDQSGKLTVSDDLFKSSMIVISSLVGCYFIYRHMIGIDSHFKIEGLVVGLVWLALNWLLDIFILIPFAKMEMGDYFISIGLRYVQIPVIAFFMGLVTDIKLEKK